MQGGKNVRERHRERRSILFAQINKDRAYTIDGVSSIQQVSLDLSGLLFVHVLTQRQRTNHFGLA
jgi:hypothetical protein